MTIRELVTRWSFDVDDTPIKNLENNINKVKRAAKVAAIAISAGFGFAIKSFVETSIEVENLQQRLISLTKSEEIAAEKFQAFQEFADRSPFTLQKIIEAGVTLEAFGLQSDNVLQGMGDLAAFMGTDLVFAASALGRAFAGGAGAADIFRDRGILELIRSTAKLKFGLDDINNLTLPKFREILLATLTDPDSKLAGGTARLAKTLSGKWSLVGDAIFRVKRTIGDALSPTIKALITDDIIPAVNALNKWIKTNIRLVGSVTKGARAVIRFTRETVKSIIDLTRRLGGVEKVLKQITFIVATLIGLKLISTIGALTIGIFKLATAFKAVGTAAIVAQAKALAFPLLIGAAVVAAGLLLEDFFVFLEGGDSVFAVLLRKLGLNVNTVRDTINQAIVKVKEFFIAAEEIVRKTLIPIGQAAIDLKNTMVEQFKAIAADVLPILKNLFKEVKIIFDAVSPLIKEDLKDLKNFIKATFSDLVKNIKSALKLITAILRGDLAGIEKQLTSIGKSTLNILSRTFEGLTNIITKALDGFVAALELIGNKLLDILGIRKQLLSFFKDVGEFATDAFDSVSDFFGLDNKEPTQGNRAARGFFATPPDNSISAGIAGRVFNTTSQSSNINQNITVSPNVTVTVPPGTPPDQIPLAIESGIENVFGRILRQTQRSGKPAIVF